jgi:hypothetical protein
LGNTLSLPVYRRSRHAADESVSCCRRKSQEAAATMEPSTESIRDLVRRTLNELGLADAAPIGESFLTYAGYYVGREFKFAGIRAVWMASQGRIKFYDDDGQVLRVVDLDEPHQAKAA